MRLRRSGVNPSFYLIRNLLYVEMFGVFDFSNQTEKYDKSSLVKLLN